MRYKTLFRLLLKAIGVWLFLEGLGGIVSGVTQVAAYFFSRQSAVLGWSIFDVLAWSAGNHVGSLVLTVAGLYLFFGGRLIANLAVPSNRHYCAECGYELSRRAAGECPECGTPLPAYPKPPPPANVTGTAPGAPLADVAGPMALSGDTTGGMIPYKNPAALTAYYLAIGSLIPFFGFVLAVPALILGIIGLRHRNRNPVIRGAVHAWVGIILGTIMLFVWTAAAIAVPIIIMRVPAGY